MNEKLWIDDLRPAPEGYKWVKSVGKAKIRCCQFLCKQNGRQVLQIEEFNLDHDSGNYRYNGGDYIELLKWLEEKQYMHDWVIDSVFKIHSGNVVGRNNMEAIIKHNNWRLEP